MKLVVHELKPSVFQVVKPTKTYAVEHIRPHIYKHGAPTGSVRVVIQDSDGLTVATSNEIVSGDLGGAYFHGYVRFDIKVHLRADQQYRVLIEHVGFTSFDEANFFGVCTDFDLRKYDFIYLAPSNLLAPLDIEFWNRTE